MLLLRVRGRGEREVTIRREEGFHFVGHVHEGGYSVLKECRVIVRFVGGLKHCSGGNIRGRNLFVEIVHGCVGEYMRMVRGVGCGGWEEGKVWRGGNGLICVLSVCGR